VISENIHTFTMGASMGVFGILRARGGVFELEIQMHGETYDWNSEGMRERRFLEGTDKNVNANFKP